MPRRTTNPPARKSPAKKRQQKSGTLTIREIKEHKDGYSWTTYLVQGWKEDGRYRKKRFSSREEADAFVARKQVELMNQAVVLHNVLTSLSPAKVKEAEAAFTRLGGRYELGNAVDYFLRHFAEPNERIDLGTAITSFLDDRSISGVRERSLVQLRATLSAFEAWLTLRHLPSKFGPDVAVARTILEQAGQTVSIRGMATMLKEQNSDLPAPSVHDATTDDIRQFLRSLRGKDGTSHASKKTWNNYRADLHAFFVWAVDKQRRWIAENPVTSIEKLKEARGIPIALNVDEARKLMDYVSHYAGGRMARYFALALFAGLRTGPDGELHKLSKHHDRDKFIDIDRGVIHVQPEVSKTGHYRQILIRSNLASWLREFPGDILPSNHDRLAKEIRANCGLGHDVLRHTFFSMHVAAFKSVGEAALEGGNTEAIVKRHYLNLSNYQEGQDFWAIVPPKARPSNISQSI